MYIGRNQFVSNIKDTLDVSLGTGGYCIIIPSLAQQTLIVNIIFSFRNYVCV